MQVLVGWLCVDLYAGCKTICPHAAFCHYRTSNCSCLKIREGLNNHRPNGRQQFMLVLAKTTDCPLFGNDQ